MAHTRHIADQILEAVAHDQHNTDDVFHHEQHDAAAPHIPAPHHAQQNQEQQNQEQQQEQRQEGAAAAADGEGEEAPAQEPPQQMTYDEFTPLLSQIWSSRRPPPDQHAMSLFSNTRMPRGPRMTTLKMLLAMFQFPADVEFEILNELCFLALVDGQERDELPAIVFNQMPRSPTLGFVSIALFFSRDAPTSALAVAMTLLLQNGATHIVLPHFDAATGTRGFISPISLARYLRTVLRNSRLDCDSATPEQIRELVGKHKNMRSFLVSDAEQRRVIRGHLVEHLEYCAVSDVDEAIATIKFLGEEVANPYVASVGQGGADNTAHNNNNGGGAGATNNLVSGSGNRPQWPTSRQLHAAAWNTMASCMAYPPQDDEPKRTGKEADRPIEVYDPQSTLYINRGDVFLKSVELLLDDTEGQAAREAAGIHPLDVHCLAYPQMFPPTLSFESTGATAAAVSGLLLATFAVRWALLKWN